MSKTMWACIAAAVSVVVVVAIFVAANVTKPERVDALGCGKEISGKTVIVLDTSDEVATQTRKEILDRVRDVIDRKVREGDLVSVFTVSELSKKNLVPAFAYCKPRRTGNEFTENPRMLERNYLTRFQRPLQDVMQAPIQGSKQSPIAQSLIDLSLSDFVRSKGNTNLIVFSDLMEYTDKFSLYKCAAGNQAIRSFRDSRGATVARPTFHNVDVQLNIIPRGDVNAAVGRCRDTFWAWFFGDDDGPGARFTPTNLPG